MMLTIGTQILISRLAQLRVGRTRPRNPIASVEMAAPAKNTVARPYAYRSAWARSSAELTRRGRALARVGRVGNEVGQVRSAATPITTGHPVRLHAGIMSEAVDMAVPGEGLHD